MKRFYIYQAKTGKLDTIDLISYRDRLPRGLSEVQLTPASEFHTVWDQSAAASGRPRLLDNGGGRAPTKDETYSRFSRQICEVINKADDKTEALLRNERIQDFMT